MLGAGGIVGQAYHAGVLAAIEEHTGWDPRTADLIVGSSAGSLTGASLRIGVPTRDLFAAAVGEPLSGEGAFLAALAEDGPEITPYEPDKLLRRWRAPTRDLVARTVRRPWAFRPSVAAVTLLPRGWVDLTDLGDALTPYLDVAWPDGLWLCTVRRDDGARIVFGRPGAPETSVGRAVAASCAIPTYFAPVEIDGSEYVDGGVHSPTNADVLRHEHLDLVIVSSPMSAAHGRARTAGAGIRWAMHRRLERELVRLRRDGTTVVRFEPGRGTLAAMGMNAMDKAHGEPAARAAKASARRRLATPEVTERLTLLTAPSPVA